MVLSSVRQELDALFFGDPRTGRDSLTLCHDMSWPATQGACARLAGRLNAQLVKLTCWYTPAELLKMATADNAELLALSESLKGERT